MTTTVQHIAYSEVDRSLHCRCGATTCLPTNGEFWPKFQAFTQAHVPCAAPKET